MAFTAITDVTIKRSGRDMVVTWGNTAPTGSAYQVYIDRTLAWWGYAATARLPWPRDTIEVDVGYVAAGAGLVDYSASLPSTPTPPNQVLLEWVGGTWEATDLAGFNIYQSAVAGGAVSYTAPVAYVPATVAGVDLSGWDMGGWNEGGWGLSGVHYSWTSPRLSSGVWTFAVVPVDLAGNAQGAPLTTTATVSAAPNPPAPHSDGTRLTYTYNPTTRVPTLSWLASPG